MNPRKRRLFALITAGLAAFFSFLFLNGVSSQAQAEKEALLQNYGGEKTEVYVATRDIYEGEQVERSDIEKTSWISSLLPQGAIRDERDLVGKKTSSLILKGEPFVEQRFKTDKATLTIPVGFSALPLSVKQAQPFSGKVNAGDTLDIYTTGQSGTHMLVHDAQVGSWPESSGASSSPLCVVIFVPTEKVQEVLEASHKTELSFVFSNPIKVKDKS